MLSDLLMWNKIGRIATILADKLGLSPLEALHVFYSSPVCDYLHDPKTGLYTYGDAYIADEVIMFLGM